MKLQKCFAFLFVGVMLTVAVAAQPVGELYDKAQYRIAMRDSVRLFTTVYTPKRGDKAPIIILRTPYGTGPYAAHEFPRNLDYEYMRSYVDRGYIIVQQDVRGRYMSEGEFVHIRPVGFGDTDEATDSYDTVDWLVKHIPGNNGCVGFVGCSYPGFYALMGGLSGHPAVKAISPQAPVTNWFMGDDVCHNGVLMLGDATRFLASMNTPAGHTPTEKMPKFSVKTTPDERTFFLENYTTRADVLKLLTPNAFWSDMAAHPDYDSWWEARDTRRACYNLRPAVLVVGGAFDAEDCFGAWNLFRAIRQQNASTPCHLVVGPWAHGAWRGNGRTLGAFDFGEEATCSYYVEHFEAPFFDHYLKGIGSDSLPVAAIFSSGDNRWHAFDRWMPREVRKTTYYLAEGGRLSDKRPAAKNSATTYISDPKDPVPYIAESGVYRPKEYMLADQRFVEDRSDVISFRSEPLNEPLTLIGAVDVALEVALSTSDADFVVKLIDVYPDGSEKPGYQMLVRGDVMRGRYRDSFSSPRAFVPDVPERVSMRMCDIAHTFGKGHRVMVQVQSSWFPLAERNPQQYVDLWRCTASDFVPCRVRLLHQKSAASAITVYQLTE